MKKRFKKIDDYFPLFKTRILYLIDFETDMIVKSVPGRGYFVRGLNGVEFEMPYGNDIVMRAVHCRNITTKKQYDKS